ncbi:MAG: leucine--tRNA ligase [Deltaproteobacteria bacterium]|nr:leucine--tRNA ligase [Deltaproteobacteria bacterium]
MKTYRDASKEFEPKWRQHWETQNIFKTPNPNEEGFDKQKPKFVVLDMFPYPSGIGLHVGHPLGYIATDILSRFMRMRGYNVLYSMGFDSFGLPAEQYAIQTGQHPRVTTDNNIRNMLQQLKMLGLSHDPTRRFSTTDPDYFRWTQWIFLQIYHSYYDPTVSWQGPDGYMSQGRARPIAVLKEKLLAGEWLLGGDGTPQPAEYFPEGRLAKDNELRSAIDKARLAYVEESPVNWCPQLGTVLSNEEVTNEGRSERGDYPVYRRPLRQWNLRITCYADRLIRDLEDVNWPNGVTEMQKAWIGRSQGARIEFPVQLNNGKLERIAVFTTRPDTLFGVTYLVLAPEHPLVQLVTVKDQESNVLAFQKESARITSMSAGEDLEKNGTPTGGFAIHPVSGDQIPIWIGDYVLMEYGTGAVMGVPGHDERDFLFAKKYQLPIIPVIQPPFSWLKSEALQEEIRVGTEKQLLDLYRLSPTEFQTSYTGPGTCFQSAHKNLSINELDNETGKLKVGEWLAEKGFGRPQVQYKLRDWLFSRQRYWGEPFPVVFDIENDLPYPLDDTELPVQLPELDNFEPKGSENPHSLPEPPLGRVKDWVNVHGVILPNQCVRLVSKEQASGGSLEVEGKQLPVQVFQRDMNSMPNWAGSCWYYLRYMDARNDHAMVESDIERYWTLDGSSPEQKPAGAIDLYVGGTEHAVLHLLYSRFWHKVLYDLGHVSTKEPFQQLFNQGMITANAYKDSRGAYVDIHEVEVKHINGEAKAFHKPTGNELEIDPGKMGKRYKNGIPPEEICDLYTTDTFRCYEMYLGPLDAGKPWKQESIIGIQRFLAGVWNLMEITLPDAEVNISTELERMMHKTIRKVTEDVRRLRMNTAIAALIECKNEFARQEKIPKSYLKNLVLLTSPFAPHLGEEMMSILEPEEHSAQKSVLCYNWPNFDPEKCLENTIEVPLMVNGKKRDAMVVAVDINEETLKEMALSNEKVLSHLNGKSPKRVVVVMQPNRKLVNIVV